MKIMKASSLQLQKTPPPPEKNSYWQRVFGPDYYTLTVNLKSSDNESIAFQLERPGRISRIAYEAFLELINFFSKFIGRDESLSKYSRIRGKDVDHNNREKLVYINRIKLIENIWKSSIEAKKTKMVACVGLADEALQVHVTENDLKEELLEFILRTPYNAEIEQQLSKKDNSEGEADGCSSSIESPTKGKQQQPAPQRVQASPPSSSAIGEVGQQQLASPKDQLEANTEEVPPAA